MDEPFSWSDISHHSPRTINQDPEDISQQLHFRDLHTYLSNILKLWGLNLPYLKFSSQNEKTLNCVMELVRRQQKDMDFRDKVQEDMAKKQYQADLAASDAKRAKMELDECRRMLGTAENKLKIEMTKSKKEIEKLTAEKTAMNQQRSKLEQKNNQLLHEVKKRQVECQKLKDNVRRPPEKATLKNGMEMVYNLKKMESPRPENPLNSILKERLEKQRQILLRETQILRNQLNAYYSEIWDFIAWLRSNSDGDRKKPVGKLNSQHLQQFSEGNILEQLQQAIEEVKDNIQWIIERKPLVPVKAQRQTQPPMQQAPRKIEQKQQIKQRPPAISELRKEPSMREMSELSLIERASMHDFEEGSFQLGRLPNGQWDILHDD